LTNKTSKSKSEFVHKIKSKNKVVISKKILKNKKKVQKVQKFKSYSSSSNPAIYTKHNTI